MVSKDLEVSSSISKSSQNNIVRETLKKIVKNGCVNCWPSSTKGKSNDCLEKKREDCKAFENSRNKEQDTKYLEVLNGYSQSINHGVIKKPNSCCIRCINTQRRRNSYIEDVVDDSSNENFQKSLQFVNTKEKMNVEFSQSYERKTSLQEFQTSSSSSIRVQVINNVTFNEVQIIKPMELQKIPKYYLTPPFNEEV